MLRSRDKIRGQLAEAVGKRNDYKKANNMDFWVQQKDEANGHLSSLRVRLTALNAEKTRLERLTPDQLLSTSPAGMSAPAGAQSGTAATDAASPAEDPVFSSDLVSQYLQTSRQVNQLQANIDEKARIWKPKHPKMIDLQTQMSRLHRDLDNFRSEAVTLVHARIASIGVWIDTTKDD